jgi:periplasmic protein CpxP/Spy
MATSLRQIVITTTAIIGLSAFAAVAAPPSAGDPTATRTPATATNGQPMRKAQPGANHNMAAKIEQRITDLHSKLHITPAQQPQWDRFSGVMRDNARDTDQTFQHRVQAMPSMTAAENMQSYAQVTAEYAQHMQNLVPAFQTLYDTMSDSQKRTADQVFRDDANRGNRTRRS